MVKKEKERVSKFSILLLFLIPLAALGWWYRQDLKWNKWKDQILQYVDNRDIITLEAQFLPDQIVEANRQVLLGNEKRTLQNTHLKFYPYLLFDVKYLEGQKTREGVLLWGLTDGEMVLNTDSWETTHGFRDCIESQANRNDFKVLHALARHQALSMSVDELQKDLRVERDLLEAWIESAKQKHLVIQKGNQLQLHFENPKLCVSPQTKVKQHLVSKPLAEGRKISSVYSHKQILNAILSAFGNEYTIRGEQEIFLPVYSIEILNPDGSLQISEWNALTGEPIYPHYLSKS